MVTREWLWTQLYVQGFSPAEAARLAEQEYRTMHPPAWIKKRR
jgi:hypothetical protein